MKILLDAHICCRADVYMSATGVVWPIGGQFAVNRSAGEFLKKCETHKAEVKTVELNSWWEFENRTRDLNRRREELASNNNRSFDAPLFRGVGNSDWDLETTLDRAYPLEAEHETDDLPGYYRHVYASKPAIETLTERRWEDIPDPPEFADLLQKLSSVPPQHFLGINISIWRYFAYLRHHGFPSPLLDWTASPYVAAFFAFDGMVKDAAQVSIYAMLRDSSSFGSAEMPYVIVLGPYLRSHRRHWMQQSQYSICLEWFPRYRFRKHGPAMASALGFAGELLELRIPASDRTVALKSLDLMNINAFSSLCSDRKIVSSERLAGVNSC